jgi:hypothetical protein
MADLDEDAARGAEIERPGPVKFPGRLGVESAGLQALMNLVHPLPALLHEADVERAGIFDLGRFFAKLFRVRTNPDSSISTASASRPFAATHRSPK